MSNRPWTALYGEMPAELEYPEITMFETLEMTARENPRASAYDYLGHRRTYRSVFSESKRVASGLWSIGVRTGDIAACVLPNCPHLLILTYALNRIGVTMAILDSEASGRDIRDVLTDLNPRWAVVSEGSLSGFQRASAGLGIRGIVTAKMSDYATASRIRKLRRRQKRRGFTGGLNGPVSPVSAGEPGTGSTELPPAFAWGTMRRLGIRNALVSGHRDQHGPDDPAVILYTGGTTGKPHGVLLSDRNVNAVARQMQVQGPILPGEKILSAVPFSHGFGFAVSVHTSVVGGGESIIMPACPPRDIARAVKRKKPEYLVGVPSFYASLLAERSFRRARLSNLMGAFVGGDRISRNLLDAFEMTVRRRGGAIGLREGYGLTETVAACVVTPDVVRRDGSVGLPAPDMDVLIVSAERDDLVPLDPGEVGEICVSGPSVMMGYVNRSGPARIVDDEQSRWLRTGDLGSMDADGFVYYVDRRESRYETAGRPFYPGLIEDTLNAHPEVREVCVTVQNGGRDLRATAHVVLSDTDLEPDWVEETLREWCRQNLPEEYQPSRIVLCSTLPHTRVGFVDYRRAATLAG